METPAPRYDVLVVDLDGTLLGPDGTVAGPDAAAIERARRAGVEVVVATGRALVESRTALEAIAHEGAVVTAGGSMLCDAATGATLSRSVMPHDLVIEVAEVLLEHDHKVLLLKDPVAAGYDYLAVGPAELDPASAWWFETLPVTVRFVHGIDEDPHPEDTVRVGVVASEAELDPIARWLRDALGDRGFLQHWAAVTSSHATNSATHLLEVFTPRVNKWTMIEAYCAPRDIPRERIAAIGDGLNDVEIVREAGLGIAMGNADQRVLDVADRVTGDHRSGGVAQAIACILGGEW
jgi:hydroxymethylpyrimidine pyrophosphatase-like HAD family hydrolase